MCKGKAFARVTRTGVPDSPARCQSFLVEFLLRMQPVRTTYVFLERVFIGSCNTDLRAVNYSLRRQQASPPVSPLRPLPLVLKSWSTCAETSPLLGTPLPHLALIWSSGSSILELAFCRTEAACA